MKIIIVSQEQFNRYMISYNINDNNVEARTNTYFISINDSNEMESWFKSNHKNVLRLYFDDITEDVTHKQTVMIKGIPVTLDERYIAMSEEQGKEIVKFTETIDINEVSAVIVHCAAGISRSGAVGTFLQEYFNLDKNEFNKMTPYIHPNPHILRILHNLTIYKHYQPNGEDNII